MYWQLGHDILECQARQGWGAKVIDSLSHDLRQTLPDMKGTSLEYLPYSARKDAGVEWPGKMPAGFCFNQPPVRKPGR